jgi:hypothetical protein
LPGHRGGLIVTAQNQHLIPPKDLEEWRDAVREYRRQHGGAGGK